MKKLLISIILVLNLNFSFGQAKKFQDVVNQYNKEMNFNGVVLVATDGKIDYLASIGIANRGFDDKLLKESKFKIASITKVFTAILIMKLYQDGKIQLNETIGKYFTTYKGEGKDKVTIHQLLTYSSGIENQAEPLAMESYQIKKNLGEYIDKYCSGKLISIPGEKSNYSNTEYILLQRIIENITAKSFQDFLEETILKPLKLNNTGILTSGKIIKSLSSSYTFHSTKKEFSNDSPYFIENYFGAGNMYSTAEDLLTLSNAIFKNKILSEITTKKMLEINENLGYTAYGFWGSAGWGNFKEKFYYRTGGILGSTSNWINTIETKKTIIVLSNTDATNLYELCEKLYLLSIHRK